MHIAMIMDGNGRWAKKLGKDRVHGHLKGVEVAREITNHCAKDETIKELTLYAFSTENWKRPKKEVDFLMNLLKKHLKKELKVYLENDIMIWDVAAGLAIVEGAGGKIIKKKGNFKNSYDVKATNGLIKV